MVKSGRPKAMKSGKAYLSTLEEYVEYCKENGRLVNIAGFCRYAGITRETYYRLKDYYPQEYDLAEAIIEDEVLNANGVNATIRIAYLNNKYDYKGYVRNFPIEHQHRMTIEELFKDIEQDAE